eukprot:9816333-Prorocentrum_lima.AAC.1
MTSSLVGSEMCIRDRAIGVVFAIFPTWVAGFARALGRVDRSGSGRFSSVSYTHLTLPTICSV